ncbi:hypothetical protein CLV33_101373 [Jejuia pallidilutea]|uniref:Uncharacterized protein n=1 Tax=Jejuia pallidilutea TaxID=504487 RepID=A0A362XDX6_9FLAO|nr:hypothetical protein [Jejuia pallidilutea]PQV51450.1 hypothetical protein CLV33_101373 [Jejuia pallidilutea]
MNYIKHLSAAFQMIVKDSRLNPTHVSLYMALFQLWNITRFSEVFYINRQEVMQFSKIGSKTTFHRCMQDLHNWKYIKYIPSHNIYKSSKVSMPIFGTTTGQVMANNKTSTGQVLVSNKNINKQIVNINKTKLPKNEIEVINFFKNNNWPAREAQKFYNHYQSIGWKIGGKIKIEDWHATASNWMIKADEFETIDELSQNKDNLKTSKRKNYGQPL